MERWAAKLLALLVIFVITLVATLLPIKVSTYFVNQGARGLHILSCLMCFGGGVFLSVYMMHMSPDVTKILDEALLKPYNIKYPVAEFIMICGFFMMVFTEYAVRRARKHKPKKILSKRTIDHDSEDQLDSKPEDNYNQNIQLGHVKHNGTIPNVTYNQEFDKSSKLWEKEPLQTNETPERKNSISKPPVDDDNDSVSDVESQGDHHDVPDFNIQSTRSVLLLLALCMHHTFEGISIGLKHSVAAVWSLCVAIVCHEIVIAFSLGMQLTKTYKSKKRIVFAAIFCSCMVPVGLAIGMSIMETGGQGSTAINITNGVLQGISTGVFIYITFFEILQTEMSNHDLRFSKLLCMLLGFLVLSALGLIPEKAEPIEHEVTNCTCT